MAKARNDKLFVKTTEFRVSHPNVFKPVDKINGQACKPRYSIEMLFDKRTTKISDLQAPLKAAIIDKWGADKADWPKRLSMPIRDGDKQTDDGDDPKPEHVGMWVVKAGGLAEFGKPHVVGKDPNVALENPSELYPGCYARAALKANAWEYMKKTGVSFILDAVQFIRDGKAIGGKKPANQLFDLIEGDEGDSDFPSEDAGDIDNDEMSFI
jgi:hypothetical protein